MFLQRDASTKGRQRDPSKTSVRSRFRHVADGSPWGRYGTAQNRALLVKNCANQYQICATIGPHFLGSPIGACRWKGIGGNDEGDHRLRVFGEIVLTWFPRCRSIKRR